MQAITRGVDHVFDFLDGVLGALWSGYARLHKWVETRRGATLTFVLLLGTLAALALSSCASLKNNQPAVKLAAQYAVIKLAEQSSTEVRPRRLANIKTIATSVQALAGNDQTTLTALRAAVGERIKQLQLSPADTLLANALADIIEEELRQRIGDGILKPDDGVFVAQVMQWVIEAVDLVAAI